MDLQYIFTSMEGRINRAKWWAGVAILGIVFIVFGVFIEVIFGTGLFGGLLATLLTVALFFPTYAVCFKRFQDRDKPGKTALYGLVPFLIAFLFSAWGLTGTSTENNALGWLCALAVLGVLLWFVIELGILKGTPGANQYGGDPLAALS
jgi:uncharacterized membrane protein YhaH (DUF805 family)